jgi:hypothetical protein
MADSVNRNLLHKMWLAAKMSKFSRNSVISQNSRVISKFRTYFDIPDSFGDHWVLSKSLDLFDEIGTDARSLKDVRKHWAWGGKVIETAPKNARGMDSQR